MAIATLHETRWPSEIKNISSLVPWRVAAGGAALAMVLADRGVPLLQRRRRQSSTSYDKYYGAGDKSIFILPGCRMDGSQLGRVMSPGFHESGDSTFFSYSDNDLVDSLQDSLIEARQSSPEKSVSFVGISIGGLLLTRLLEKQQFSDEFGSIDTVVLDSSPSTRDTLRPGVRRALSYSRLLDDSWTGSETARMLMQRHAKSRFDDEMDEAIRKLYLANSNMPLSDVRAQASLIPRGRTEPGSLADAPVRKVYYVHAPGDPVVDTEAAARDYQAAYRDKLEVVVDESRPAGSHAASVTHQQLIDELINS